mgnify:CR=1 FL=1
MSARPLRQIGVCCFCRAAVFCCRARHADFLKVRSLILLVYRRSDANSSRMPTTSQSTVTPSDVVSAPPAAPTIKRKPKAPRSTAVFFIFIHPFRFLLHRVPWEVSVVYQKGCPINRTLTAFAENYRMFVLFFARSRIICLGETPNCALNTLEKYSGSV